MKKPPVPDAMGIRALEEFWCLHSGGFSTG
jgi:hypothetical protein